AITPHPTQSPNPPASLDPAPSPGTQSPDWRITREGCRIPEPAIAISKAVDRSSKAGMDPIRASPDLDPRDATRLHFFSSLSSLRGYGSFLQTLIRFPPGLWTLPPRCGRFPQ